MKTKGESLNNKICGLSTFLSIISPILAILLGILWLGGQIAPAQSASGGAPQERWVYTTNSHFSWYGLLALSPIYREPIYSALLDSNRVYVTIGRSGGGTQVLALDRRNGQVIWQQRVVSLGWPVGGSLVLLKGRLILAVQQGQTDVTIIALNASDGAFLWQVPIAGIQQPSVFESILSGDVDSDTIEIYNLRVKEKNRIILRGNDGEKVAELSYNSYIWPYGVRRAAGLVFGYDGIPLERKYNRLLAYNERTTRLAWSLPLSPPRASPPQVVETSVCFTSDDQLFRLDSATGAVQWRVKLDGRIPADPAPPLIIGSQITVIYNSSPKSERNSWILATFRLLDGKQESTLKVDSPESVPWMLRQMGDLIIVGSSSVLQILDAQQRKIAATLDFDKKFSPFVYADPPSMHIADSDSSGFLAVTTDGQLRYFAADDFRAKSVPQRSAPAR